MRNFSVEHMIEESPYCDVVILEPEGLEDSLDTKVKKILLDKDYGQNIRLTTLRDENPIDFVSRVATKVAIDRSVWIGTKEYEKELRSSGSPFVYVIEEDTKDEFITWMSNLLSRKVAVKELKNKIAQKDHAIALYEKEKREALDLIKVLEHKIFESENVYTKEIRKKMIYVLSAIGLLVGGILFFI